MLFRWLIRRATSDPGVPGHGALLLALMILFPGCPNGTATRVPDDRAGKPVVTLVQDPQAEQSPLDAPPAMQIVFQVDIYQLSFPLGTYGTNEEFWKRIDEQCVDPATYDSLWRNGIRVGVAPRREMQHFEQYMRGVVPVKRLTITASDVKNVELEAKSGLTEQIIWQFDANNRLSGRSADRSDNIINISFEPAPRKPGALRLSLCPMVRAQRKHLEFSLTNEEREISYVSPESMYDLNIRADVPMDCFFIVAPTELAHRRSVVGRAFFTNATPTQVVEQVLLVIPRPYRAPEGDQGRESVMPK